MSGSAPPLRSPDWDALTALLDALCRAKGLLTKAGAPSYPQLAAACGLHHSSLQAWRRHEQRPSLQALEALAHCAGQPVGPWLRAGGFDEGEHT